MTVMLIEDPQRNQAAPELAEFTAPPEYIPRLLQALTPRRYQRVSTFSGALRSFTCFDLRNRQNHGPSVAVQYPRLLPVSP